MCVWLTDKWMADTHITHTRFSHENAWFLPQNGNSYLTFEIQEIPLSISKDIYEYIDGKHWSGRNKNYLILFPQTLSDDLFLRIWKSDKFDHNPETIGESCCIRQNIATFYFLPRVTDCISISCYLPIKGSRNLIKQKYSVVMESLFHGKSQLL